LHVICFGPGCGGADVVGTFAGTISDEMVGGGADVLIAKEAENASGVGSTDV